MVFINYTAMQITSKIVYYGPGLCGKTTNLQAIHEGTSPQSRGEMVSLETETDRTLFFDLLPLEVGIVGGMKVRLQLYTVPGQVFYNATRKLVLKGVDGVVFVVDSQVPAFDANIESLGNLQANLAELGLSLDQLPLVMQYNKRDLRNITPLEKLNEALNPRGHPHFEAAALHGVGVFETLKAISRLAIADIRRKIAADATPRRRLGEPQPAGPPPASVAAPSPAPGVPESAHPLELLVSSPPEVDFAASGDQPQSVATRGQLGIREELQKLRATAMAPRPAAVRPAARLEDLLSPGEGTREDVKRKASLEVPGSVLKEGGTLKVQLTFEMAAPGGEDFTAEALSVKLGANRRLERLTLHLDLDVKGKP